MEQRKQKGGESVKILGMDNEVSVWQKTFKIVSI